MKIILAVCAAFLATTLSAVAADRTTKPTFDWTGFYLGAQAGYQWSVNEILELGVDTSPPAGDLDADGAVGGIHVGYNFQLSSVVLGIEGDFEGSGVEGSGVIDPLDSGTEFDFEQNWQASIRGRRGLALDRVLIYATGGYAWQDADLRLSFPGLESGGSSETIGAWTVGGGVEMAIQEHWTSRLEYRYFESDDEEFEGSGDFACCTYGGENFVLHTVRAGVSYKFGGAHSAAAP